MNAESGAMIHAETMVNISDSLSEFVANPNPTIAPTAVIDVDAGTPNKFEMSSANPAKKRTMMLVPNVNWLAGTMPLLIVSMTFLPTVQPPQSAKTVKSVAAPTLPMIRLPTAGPNATPVEEPPML